MALRDTMKSKVLANTTPGTETDAEYYYAVGQLLGYLFSLKRWTNKGQSVLSNILNAGSDKVVKDCILQQWKLVNKHISEDNKRVKNLLSMTMGYIPDKGIREMGETVLLGYSDNNLVTWNDGGNEK